MSGLGDVNTSITKIFKRIEDIYKCQEVFGDFVKQEMLNLEEKFYKDIFSKTESLEAELRLLELRLIDVEDNFNGNPDDDYINFDDVIDNHRRERGVTVRNNMFPGMLLYSDSDTGSSDDEHYWENVDQNREDDPDELAGAEAEALYWENHPDNPDNE